MDKTCCDKVAVLSCFDVRIQYSQYISRAGLNDNAAILRNESEAGTFIAGVLATQPQVDVSLDGATGTGSRDGSDGGAGGTSTSLHSTIQVFTVVHETTQT